MNHTIDEITLLRYEPEMISTWNQIVRQSRNGTFLFEREFMDYHCERFMDHSLVISSQHKPIALFPANEKNNTLYSHQGLTYGGIILRQDVCPSLAVQIFDSIVLYAKNKGMKQMIYKPVPTIYHQRKSEEDLYGLFRHNFSLSARSLSSVIELQKEFTFKTLRKRGIKKALNSGSTCALSDNFEPFWEILTQNLNHRYGKSPVHSLQEIEKLHQQFPQKILLYTVLCQDQIVAGVVCFDTFPVLHIQYIGASAKGKEIGALDLLFDHLIRCYQKTHTYFDFGISTEEGGTLLNEGLLHQKEGFGAFSIVYDQYTLSL